MRIEPMEVMTFDADGKITSTKAYWSAADITQPDRALGSRSREPRIASVMRGSRVRKTANHMAM